ncbi:DUF4124 domain-containing protein [Pseudomonas sp. UL073]|uniref:DUF4124 domain-containing protein n=1 Tax=Zestomonas insulae TaxID=2809017 RepID=A0ABS2IF26_9GAMM|nr:DUF4124 domain-containing protein [Pseudomonas insulae]MBM7061696.1 DUF4124 domain-containing protein [Pseudomonas insulae]
MHRVCCAVWLCVALSGAQAAEIYRWTDASGQVHFSAKPQAGAKQVEVKPQVVERDAATREREAKADRFYEARRQEQQSASAQQAERQEKRSQECGVLRERLSQVSRGGRYYHVDDRGQQVYYSDEQIETARRQLIERIEQQCS